MCPNAEMCKGCFYWRRLCNGGGDKYDLKGCLHLYYTGECWKRGENGCESKVMRRRVKR